MPNFNDPKWIREQQELIAKRNKDSYAYAVFSENAHTNYPAALAEIARLQKERDEIENRHIDEIEKAQQYGFQSAIDALVKLTRDGRTERQS